MSDIGTCGLCGAELAYNVPRLGPGGGYVHKSTGKLDCGESPGDKLAQSKTHLEMNLSDKESIVELMFQVQNGYVSCRRAAAEIQSRYNAALDKAQAAITKSHDRQKVSDELADGLIEENRSLKELCDRVEKERDAARNSLETAISLSFCPPQKATRWRECAEGLARAFKNVPHDPLTIGYSGSQDCKKALAEFDRLEEETK